MVAFAIDVLENKINNKKLTVVGYYEGKNMLVNENMIKYELISKSKNLTIMPSDSKIAIESLNNENLNVVKSYDSAKEKYLDSSCKIWSYCIWSYFVYFFCGNLFNDTFFISFKDKGNWYI